MGKIHVILLDFKHNIDLMLNSGINISLSVVKQLQMNWHKVVFD